MASLESRFKAIQRDNPHHSSFVNFSRTIRGQKLSRERLGFFFRKLVDKDDYAKSDIGELLISLFFQTQNDTPWLSHYTTTTLSNIDINSLIAF